MIVVLITKRKLLIIIHSYICYLHQWCNFVSNWTFFQTFTQHLTYCPRKLRVLMSYFRGKLSIGVSSYHSHNNNKKKLEVFTLVIRSYLERCNQLWKSWNNVMPWIFSPNIEEHRMFNWNLSELTKSISLEWMHTIQLFFSNTILVCMLQLKRQIMLLDWQVSLGKLHLYSCRNLDFFLESEESLDEFHFSLSQSKTWW